MRGLAIVLALMLVGCVPIREEVERVPSPDRAVEAVVVRVNAGATVSFYHDVYVVSAGSKARGPEIADFYGLYGPEGRSGWLHPVWIDDGALELRFEKARQGNLRRDFVEIAGRRIRLECNGSVDAPDRNNRCVAAVGLDRENPVVPGPSVDAAS